MLTPAPSEQLSTDRQSVSNNGQVAFEANGLIARTPNSLIARVFGLDKNEHDEPHTHPWHQLLLPRSGMLRTRTAGNIYFVPCNRAALIPAGTIHESWALTRSEFAGIYIDPAIYCLSTGQCRIIEVTPLLDALIFEVLKLGQRWNTPHSSADQRMIAVLVDQLTARPDIDLSVTLPDEKRLQPIIQDLLTRPDSKKSLSDWSKTVGASERTISRQFQKLTGLSFVRWRQKVRMISALTMLEEGRSIQEIAHNVGYSSASAFIHSFRREFGTTPQRYYLRGA